MPPKRSKTSKSSSKAITKEALNGQTPEQIELVALLPQGKPNRLSRDPSSIELKPVNQRTAALLYRRGSAISPCTQCGPDRTWNSCVVAPIYKGRSMFGHACANCVFKNDAAHCSHREAFMAGGGQIEIIARGGLYTVLKEEASGSPLKLVNMSTPSATDSQTRSVKIKAQKKATTTGRKPRKRLPKTPKTLKTQPAASPVGDDSGDPSSALDGQYVPWSVLHTEWNNLASLRSIVDDMKFFTAMADARIAELESSTPAIEHASSYDFWNAEVAKLFGL
ncbi:hypothetical protein BJX64DRAFT_292676 [Aspergillus heterothallicus]